MDFIMAKIPCNFKLQTKIQMTKEEFYRLAKNKPEITDTSIYTLKIIEYDKDTKTYRKRPKSDEWEFKVRTVRNDYSSKESAEKALREYKLNEGESYRKNIHSAMISRYQIDIPVEDHGSLEWWLYDKDCNEIDRSVCSWEVKDDPELRDVYFGREPSQIRFQMGDIVEIQSGDKIFLSVINGLPTTIDRMWEIYEERFKKSGPQLDELIMRGDFYDAMAGTYYYIQSNGFDPDTWPYLVFKPTFPVPEDIKKILKGRYNCWKSYIDSHSREEINEDELYSLIQGVKC